MKVTLTVQEIMNALELAADFEEGGVYTDAVAMLRRQHEAIVKLREALEQIYDLPEDSRISYKIARRFLEATKEFQ